MTLQKAFNFLKQRSKSCHISKKYLKQSNTIPIRSFKCLSKKDYFIIRRMLIDDYNLKLPRRFPIHWTVQKKIHKHVYGIYLGHCIYINDKKSIQETASTIIHELDHHIYGDDFETSKEMELHAITVEWYFQNPNKRLTRQTQKELENIVDEYY